MAFGGLNLAPRAPVAPRKPLLQPFGTTKLQQLINQFQTGSAMTPEQEAAQAKQAADAARAAAAASYNAPIAASSANPYTSASAAMSQSAAPTSVAGGGYQSGSSNTTTPGAGDTWDGFARRYLQGESDNILSNPKTILHDYLSQDGRNTPINLEGDLGRYAQAAPGLYTILTGGNPNPDVQANDKIINYVAKLMGGLSTVGGQAPTTRQLLNQFYAGLNDKDSTIGINLYGTDGSPVDSQSQVDYINKMIPFLGTFTNYNYSQAMQKQAARLGQEYMSMAAQGKTGGKTYAQYLQENFLR